MTDRSSRSNSGGGKWICGVSADMPAVDAARRILRDRLRAVERQLRRAGRSPRPRAIHALRVATRRAEAALRLLQPCLGEEDFRRQRKALRRIRRAAATARQCDVQAEALRSATFQLVDDALRSATEDTERWIRMQGDAARKAVQAVARRYPRRELRQRRKTLLMRLTTPDFNPAVATGKVGHHALGRCSEVTFKSLAGAELPAMCRAMAEAARADLREPVALHTLRIRAKAVRYALEVFRPCVQRGFEDLYTDIESLQQALGEINDAAELAESVASYRDLSHETTANDPARLAGVRALLRQCEDRRDALVHAFLSHWKGGRWRRVIDLLACESIGNEGGGSICGNTGGGAAGDHGSSDESRSPDYVANAPRPDPPLISTRLPAGGVQFGEIRMGRR